MPNSLGDSPGLNVRKKKIFNLLIYLAYLIIAIVSFHKVFFLKGTIGHRIDWFIPSSVEQLQRLGSESLYIWRSLNLGIYCVLNFTVVIEKFLGWLGGIGLNGEFVSKIFPVFFLALASFFMFNLTEAVFRRYLKSDQCILVSFVCGIIYGFSPVVFNEIIAGHLVYVVAYVFIPSVFSCYLQGIDKKYVITKYIVISALIFNLTVFQPQILIMFLGIILCFILFSDNKKLGLKAFLIFILFTMLFQSFWILMLIVHVKSNLAYFKPFIREGLANKKLLLLKPIEILTLCGFSIPWFKNAIDAGIPALWYLSTICIILGAFLSLIIYAKNNFILFSAFIIITSFFFMGVGGDLFRNINEYIHQNFIFMQLFRSVHYFMFMPALFYPILFGASIVYIKRRITLNSYRFLIGFLFITILIYLYPIFSGDMAGNIQLFNDSKSYSIIDDYLKKEQGDYRVLYLPAAISPVFKDSKFQDYFGYGADPVVSFSSKPTLVSDYARWDAAKAIAVSIERTLYKNLDLSAYRLLDIANIKYLMLRNDRKYAWGFGALFWSGQNAYSVLFNRLNNQKNIILVRRYSDMSLWENRNFYPHIYFSHNADAKPPQDINVMLSVSNVGYLNGVFDNDRMIWVEPYRLAQYEKIDDSMHLTFKKINPTKYLVKIERAKEPFWLVFSESFHNQWRIYSLESNKVEGIKLKVKSDKVENQFKQIVVNYPKLGVKEAKHLMQFTPQDIKYLFRKPLNATHGLVNGYANGWYIEPKKLGLGEDFVLVIYFWPQSLFYLGLGISGLTLLFCIIYLIYYFIKKRRKNLMVNSS